MRVRRGKKTVEISDDELRTLAGQYGEVLLDLGTGDGLFVYRQALAHPATLCVGVDPVGEAMAKTSGRAGRKAARGGAPNALFVVAAVEDLPAGLAGVADRVTINYPWGSLLRGLVEPDPGILSRLRAVLRPRARLVLLLNYHVFADREYVERLGLPALDEEHVASRMAPAFAESGLPLRSSGFVDGEPPHRTSWGQRLVKGSGRRTLRIEAEAE